MVGLSNRPERARFDVAAYMQSAGYRIVAVNPMYAGQTILGEHCHASLQEASAALAQDGLRIAIVDHGSDGVANELRVLLRDVRAVELVPALAPDETSGDIPPFVEEAIAIGAECVWMQLDIVHEEAAARARAAGLKVVMDKCIKIEHAMGQSHGVL